MKILGIDPGSTRVGYGLIKENCGEIGFIKAGLLKIHSKDKDERLVELAKSYEQLLRKEKPDLVAIEKLYFVKNMKTGLEVAQSRGVINYLTALHKIPSIEFTPSEVKLNIAGHGAADKKAVEKMVKLILGTKKIEGPDDVFDALAIAIAGANELRLKNLTP